jgi:chemotaxis protein MotB
MADNEVQMPADEPEEGAPEWLVTFGDLMSLLLTFFVLLLSFSQTDVAKFKELAGSLEQAFGVQRQEPVYNTPQGMQMVARDFDQAFVEQASVGEPEHEEPLFADITAQLHALLEPLEAQGLVELETQGTYLVMRLLGHSTFNSGKAEIRADMLQTLQAIGKIVGSTAYDIFVAGHTDNIPTRGGPYRSNLDLSVARAASVVEFFVTQDLVAADKIATMGFGEYRPLVPNDTAENRQKNRRVEIILSASQTLPANGRPFAISTPLLLSPAGAK